MREDEQGEDFGARECEVAQYLAAAVDGAIARAVEGRRLVVNGTVAADGEPILTVTELRGVLLDEFAGYGAFGDGLRLDFDDEARLHVSYDPCRFCTEFDPTGGE